MLSAVIALLPDNTSGEISPQDLRDFLVSIWGVYGALSVYNNGSAQSLNTTPAKITAFSINGGGAGTTASESSDQITIDTDGVFLVHFTATISAMTANTLYSYHIAKNGTRVSGASAAVNVQSTNDVANVAITYVVSCAATDIITILGESDNGSGVNQTVKHAQLVVHRLY